MSIIVLVKDEKSEFRKTIRDIKLQDYKNVETIVVNISANATLPERRGLTNIAELKNLAVNNAEGTYILILFSGDRIHTTYVDKAIQIFTKKKNIGVVYCQPVRRKSHDSRSEFDFAFSFPAIIFKNSIISSSFFKKQDWKKNSGFDSELRDGWEDYDLWLSIIEKGGGVFFIPEKLFNYSERRDPMPFYSRGDVVEKYTYLFNKHYYLYRKNIRYLFEVLVDSIEQNSAKTVILKPIIVSRVIDNFPFLKKALLLLLKVAGKLRIIR